MRRLGRIAAAGLLVIAVFTGCEFLDAFMESDENDILTFLMDGIVGSASINPGARTVTLEVEPMDISTVQPAVTVSQNATYVPQTLRDGIPVTFIVTAEDGSQATWTITVNVQHGVSFEVDGTRYVFTEGYVDNTYTYTPDEIGNGVPPAYWSNVDMVTYVDAFAQPKQIPWDQTDEYTYIGFPSTTTGEYVSPGAFFQWEDQAAGESFGSVPSQFTVNVTSYGGLGETVTGTFSGQVSDGVSQHELVEGFFKGVLLPDDPPVLPL